MAKVVGPIYSQQASGHIAKAVVFSRLGGQNVVRGYTVQPEKATEGQIAVRIPFAVAGLINRRIRAANWRIFGEEETIIEWTNRRTILGEVWSSTLTRLSIGREREFYNATTALWIDIGEVGQFAWEFVAQIPVAGLNGYTRENTIISPGFMLFLNQRMLGINGYGREFIEENPQLIVNG